MSQGQPLSLPRFDRRLLRAAERLVPATGRGDWSKVWHAELWHMHDRSRRQKNPLSVIRTTADLSVGLVCDALWLRMESWRRRYSGTPALCICSLLCLCVLSILIAFALGGTLHPFSLPFADRFFRSLLAAPLILFVAYATANRRHTEPGSTAGKLHWIKRQLFFSLKVAELLTLAFLLSVNLCQPLRASFPNTAYIFQILAFVVLALIGLRWAFRDQEQRCKQCLRSLALPARVGRPSRNLLEWNGTELSCKQGHGSLSIPEIETSWCQSSQWVSLISN